MLILPSWSAAVPTLTTRQNPNRQVPLMLSCLRCRHVTCDMFSVDLNEDGGGRGRGRKGEGGKARLLNCWVNSGPGCFPGAVIGWAAPLSGSALFGFGFKSSPPAAYTANTRVVEWQQPFERQQVSTHLLPLGVIGRALSQSHLLLLSLASEWERENRGKKMNQKVENHSKLLHLNGVKHSKR